VIAFLFIAFVISALRKERTDAPVKLPGHPLLAVFPFFRQRFNFLNWGFQVTGQSIFQFQLLLVR
jgi:sterol 14-demethylase